MKSVPNAKTGGESGLTRAAAVTTLSYCCRVCQHATIPGRRICDNRRLDADCGQSGRRLGHSGELRLGMRARGVWFTRAIGTLKNPCLVNSLPGKSPRLAHF